jgi:putative protease
MSSKDLEGVRYVEKMALAGIDSIKVEGRMKSQLYAGTISKVYRDALDFYKTNKHFNTSKIIEWENELRKLSHRSYSEASLIHKADETSIFDEREHTKDSEWKMCGTIMEANPNEALVMLVLNAFNLGDTLEILPFSGSPISFTVNEMTTVDLKPLERTKPSTLIKLPPMLGAQKMNLVRLWSK